MDNSRILVISDMQSPFHHKDSIAFLKEIKRQLKPTRIISIGDLYDFNFFSDYGKNPNLFSGRDELELVQAFSKELYKVFPVMDILDSNHGNRIRRQAFKAGLPTSVLKSEMDIIGGPKTWKLHSELIIKLPNGRLVKLVHNFSSNVLASSKDQAMSIIQGHFHSKFEVVYWSNGVETFFGATIGCLIDDTNRDVFGYNSTQAKRPVLGTLFLNNSIPMLIPMSVDKKNNWVGYI
jgi:hypothetical protein